MQRLSRKERRSASSSPASLRQHAYDRIKEAILQSILAPGQALSEYKLAAELRISRTPIREALRDLCAVGLVKLVPKRGAVVSELSVREIIELYELRELLECHAVRIACLRMSEHDCRAMADDHHEALDQLQRGRTTRAYEFAIRLHARILKGANNNRLSAILEQLQDLTNRLGLLTARKGARGPEALDEHERLIDAIRQRDPDSAEALLRAHIRADRDVAVRLALGGRIVVESERT